MMTTVPHVTSGSELRKIQADGFLLDRVYKHVFGAHVLFGIYFPNNINIYSSLRVTDQF